MKLGPCPWPQPEDGVVELCVVDMVRRLEADPCVPNVTKPLDHCLLIGIRVGTPGGPLEKTRALPATRWESGNRIYVTCQPALIARIAVSMTGWRETRTKRVR